jgi:hypothetical protein
MTEKRPGVAFYGKVRIPTIGHRKAIDAAKGIAKKVGGKLSIGLSGTSKPLTPETKKSHAEMMFNHPVDTGDDHSKNLFSYLSHLNKHHDEIHLVAGSDRASEYRRTLQDWNGRADKSGKTSFNFKKWKVHEVEGERGEVNKHPSKMSKDELERSVSATKLEGLAKSDDYEGFKAYHPGFPEHHVRKVYNQIRMDSSESSSPKTVKQIKAKKIVKEEFHDHGEMDHKKFGPMLDTFVQFASKKIGIKDMPTMKLEKDPMTNSFGGYNPAEKSIVVITKNRHPMDIYRTVAHELVHHKQNEDGRLGKDIQKEGATGSPIENEANAEAGKVMRWFAKSNPDMFKSRYVTESYLDEGINDPAKGKAIFMAGGPGSGKDWIGDRAGLLAKGKKTGHGLTEINSDNALEHLMKMRGLDPMMPKEEDYERNLARGTAKNVTKEKERLALAGRRGVVINGTADDPEYIATVKKHLEDLGYETKMLFVNTNDKVSKQRNLDRGLQGGRKVPDGTDKNGRPDGSPDIRGEKWQAAQDAKEPLKKLFGSEHFIHVDNSEDYREVSKERKKEIDDQHNQLFKHYRQFVSAPNETEKSKEWIEAEKKKRGITQYKPAKATKVSQKKPVASYVPNASELEQAKRLGVQHIGGGQFGKSKEAISHVSKNGQLTMNEEKYKKIKACWKGYQAIGFKNKNGKKVPNCVPVDEDKDPCWKGYQQIGMKNKGGRKVPNCVPVDEAFAKMVNENKPSDREEGKKSLKNIYTKDTPGQKKVEEGISDSLGAFGRGLADKATLGGYKYARAAADYGVKKALGKNTTYQRELDQEKEKLDKDSKDNPTASGFGDAAGYALPYVPALGSAVKAAQGAVSSAKDAATKGSNVGSKLKRGLGIEEDNVIPRGGIGYSGIGDETTVYRPMVASGYGGAGTIPMYESVVNWMNNPKTQERFIEKYGNNAEQKLYETAMNLNQLEFTESGPKFFTHLREAWEAIGNRDMGTVAKQGSKEEVYEEDDENLKKLENITAWLKSGGEVKLPNVNDLPDNLKQFKVNENDVIKTSKTLKGYKKNVHPMSTFEKKSLAEATPKVINERGADSKGLYRSTESGAGLTRKGAKKFGIKTAVTTPPSKLDPGGKAAKRRKSFCARMGGMEGPMKDEKGRPTRKAMSLRRWNCEE